jgi:autotransporter-associated beta strand protein
VLTSGAVIDSEGGGTMSASFELTSGTISASLAGSGYLTQNGVGATTLNAANTFTGATSVTQGILALASAGALGSTTQVFLETGGTLLLSASNTVNDSATFTWSGGAMQVAGGVTETLGLTSIPNPSLLDSTGSGMALTFTSLAVLAQLDVWNWNPLSDSLTVTGAAVSGDVSRIRFYSDNGSTFLGTGTLEGTSIVAVPEPATIRMLVVALALLFTLAAKRQRPTSARR